MIHLKVHPHVNAIAIAWHVIDSETFAIYTSKFEYAKRHVIYEDFFNFKFRLVMPFRPPLSIRKVEI